MYRDIRQFFIVYWQWTIFFCFHLILNYVHFLIARKNYVLRKKKEQRSNSKIRSSWHKQQIVFVIQERKKKQNNERVTRTNCFPFRLCTEIKFSFIWSHAIDFFFDPGKKFLVLLIYLNHWFHWNNRWHL